MPRFRVEQPFPMGRSLVQLGQVKVPRRFTAHVFDHEDGSPDVQLVFEVRNGVPECREVHITATDAGREVQCSGLAGIRVQDVLEATIKELVLGHVAETEPGQYRVSPFPTEEQRGRAVKEVREARSARKVTVTDAVLQEVAEVYRANPRRPTAAVAEHFDKSHRTAALWVKRAREAGHLGAAVKGKGGER